MTEIRTLTVRREIIPELRLIPADKIIEKRGTTPPKPFYGPEDLQRLDEIAAKLLRGEQPEPVFVVTTNGGMNFFLLEGHDVFQAVKRLENHRDSLTGHHVCLPYVRAAVFYLSEDEITNITLN